MFGIFGDKRSKLKKRYARLLAESFRLSTIDRKESDLKAAQADAVLKELDALDRNSQEA